MKQYVTNKDINLCVPVTFTYNALFASFLWGSSTLVVSSVRLPNQCITVGYLICWNIPHDKQLIIQYTLPDAGVEILR